jgi:hypothetical protein
LFGGVTSSQAIANGIEVKQRAGNATVTARLTFPHDGVMRYEVTGLRRARSGVHGDLSGKHVGLADFRGHQTLLLFWNPGCAFCNRMLPASRFICARIQRVLQRWYLTRRFLPKSTMGKALSYALVQWESLEDYLKEPRIEIDTNLVEKAIRPTALGKKNLLFFGDADAVTGSNPIVT